MRNGAKQEGYSMKRTIFKEAKDDYKNRRYLGGNAYQGIRATDLILRFPVSESLVVMQAVMKKVLAFISCEYFLWRDRCFGVDRERASGTGDVKPAWYGEQEEEEEIEVER